MHLLEDLLEAVAGSILLPNVRRQPQQLGHLGVAACLYDPGHEASGAGASLRGPVRESARARVRSCASACLRECVPARARARARERLEAGSAHSMRERTPSPFLSMRLKASSHASVKDEAPLKRGRLADMRVAVSRRLARGGGGGAGGAPPPGLFERKETKGGGAVNSNNNNNNVNTD